ncbi:hypothetical protein SK128_015799 [Halocaridina rubra]|uniref:Uncharacterized protein n=1 Tax=Halocaridina rubra TaxID=373956 RepID=A0AAN8WI08_HALRR
MKMFVATLFLTIPMISKGQFVPGFLVESGTDLQEYPKNLSALFPDNTSPEEQQDYYANAIASLFGSGTITAALPDHNPVEVLLQGPIQREGLANPEYPGQEVYPNGTAMPIEEFTQEGMHAPGYPPVNDCSIVAFSVARAHYKHRKAGTRGIQVLFDKVSICALLTFNH